MPKKEAVVKVEEVENELTFERMEGENPISFHYFCQYRDMGVRRTYQKVATQNNVSLKVITDAAKKWQWQDRIKLWTDEIDRLKREAYIHEIQEMAKRHARHSMNFQKVLTIPTDAILKKIKDNDLSYQDFINLPVSELFDKSLKSAQIFSSIVDIERKSRGLPTELIKQETQNENYEEIKVILPIIPNPNQDNNATPTENN